MRKIKEIANDILKEWKDNIYFGAKPYLLAMMILEDKNDKYGYDEAKSIIRYFLSNARTFRGEKARNLKQELKEHLK